MPSLTFGFIGGSDASGEWFASTVRYAGSGSQARGGIGQQDQLGEWFSSAISYNSSPTYECPWLGQNDAMGEWIDANGDYEFMFQGSAVPAVGAVLTTTYLPIPSVEELPAWILQANVGAHPRPFDGSDVSTGPGNIVTFYYNDIHERSGPDTSLIAAFNSPAGAFVFLGGPSLPAQYRGLHQVTAYGADKPYHDTEDTHNWFQFICGGSPAGLFSDYGGTAYYQQVTFSIPVTITPAGVITYPPGLYFRDGFRGMTWMKNVVSMTRDYWDQSLSTPYSGQLYPPPQAR